jgi:hypothetical protein
MQNIVILLSLLLLSDLSFGQVFNKRESFRGSSKITTKQFNGTGRKGYWNLKIIDSKSRIAYVEYFKKTTLIGRQHYKYNNNDDEILVTATFDINNPNRVDTISATDYEYDNKLKIVSSKTLMGQTVITIKLINSSNDTLKTYEKIVYDKDKITSKDSITVHLNHLNQIDRLNISDLLSKSSETHYKEYYNNGKLKRRKIESMPKSEMAQTYIGGPGSDDESYDYKYYKDGRVKNYYIITNNKRYLLETYKHEK